VALQDGRHFGFIRSIDTGSDPLTLEYDAAQMLFGPIAQNAAEEDGVVEEGEPVPNDYYVRNPDEAVQVVPVASFVRVTRVDCSIDCDAKATGSFEELAASFEGEGYTYEDPYRGAESQYWLTVADGRVVEIDEQYLP
jgi:hypothetical protein